MVRIYPSIFNGTLKAPASKAHAQRLLFASSLPTSFTLVKNVPDCDDINTTMECLERFGCRLATNEHRDVIVEPFPKTVPVPTAEFNFKKSGTTARTALAISGALGVRVEAKAGASLSKRAMIPLIGRMAIRGITFSNFAFPLEMKGRLSGGEYVLRGDEGDEFISALMMALPLISEDSRIRFETPLLDPSYVNMTAEVLEKYGITIQKTEDGYDIEGRQQYDSPGQITAENDMTLASFWMSAGAASAAKGGHVKVTGLPENSPQNYKDIRQFLSLISQDFSYLDMNFSNAPELAVLLACMAIVKGVEVSIRGVAQLKAMETDRLSVLCELARASGGEAELTETGLTIRGSKERSEDFVFDCHDDPYIFIGMALSASVADKAIVLGDENCADKIYRNFFTDFSSLGGKFEIIGG